MTMLAGDNAVSYARFAALKGALKLESLGMKTRGGALRPRLAKEFGLSPRAPHLDYIGHCVLEMEKCYTIRQQELTQEGTVINEEGDEVYL